MEKELNINNSKKLIIGISILFCTVILIIGATTAYFTQSDTKEIGNLVTENINGTLGFSDNNNYMFGNFIPVEENDVLSFASKTNRCNYQDDMYACNMYEFTVTNNSNVTQELKITLNTIENGLENLYYNFLESSINNVTTDKNYITSKEQIKGTGEKEILNNIILKPNEQKTYTIIYYIKNLSNKDQTSGDANKKFYARVRIDSITTGMYAGTLMEDRCYGSELITEGEYTGTYKLTSFNGIDSSGNEDTSCGVTKTGDFYSVTVPSKLKDENGNELNISTLGNNLFMGLNSDFTSNYNAYINDITIENGIEIIDDGYENQQGMAGTFAFVGASFAVEGLWFKDYQFNIKLPNTLKHLGAYAFYINQIYTLNIPASVEKISNNVIGDTNTQKFLNELTFEGADTNKSKLTTIGAEAFNNINIENLAIPASVKTIENKAFTGIGSLSKITFMGATTNDSLLEEIGEEAFYNASLNYVNEPLVLPGTLTKIGDNAFKGDTSRIENFQKVLFMGRRTNLNKLGTNWYTSPTVVTANIEE